MNGKTYDAVGLGELLIDFAIVPGEESEVDCSNAADGVSAADPACGASEELRFAGNPGGAPPNVLAELARLGKKTAFIGKVGDDMFGARLRRALTDAQIDDAGLLCDPDAFTTLAFVSIDERGEREFSFARKNSWLTGTAAWTFLSISQAILGVTPTLDGLSVDPCVPKSLGGFSVSRRFRGATYEITVDNSAHVEKGVRSLTVDGKAVDGAVIPVAPAGSTVKVLVTMG